MLRRVGKPTAISTSVTGEPELTLQPVQTGKDEYQVEWTTTCTWSSVLRRWRSFRKKTPGMYGSAREAREAIKGFLAKEQRLGEKRAWGLKGA